MESKQEPLISISEASRMLGVSEPTLRQWTAEGRIKAFITPGGHRRYSVAELKKFIGSHQKALGIKDLALELEDTTQAHHELVIKSAGTIWYNKLDTESREHLADMGRRLHNLVIRYITEPSKREETLALVREAGHNHGETLARLGLPLTDSVEAFILHRNPAMNAASHFMKKKDVVTGRVIEALPLIAQAMDEALVSLVAAHQGYKDKRKPRGRRTAGDINNTSAL